MHITKWNIFKPPFKAIALPTLGFGGVGFVILQIITLVVDDPLSWSESILIGLGQFVFWLLLWTILSVPMRLTGLIQLNRQERVLNFSFNEEMQKNNIAASEHMSNLWFVSAKNVVVLHRDYIRGIKNDEVMDINGDGFIFQVIFLTADGKELKLKGISNRVLLPVFWYIDGEPKNEKGEPKNEYLRNLVVNIAHHLDDLSI